MMSPETIFLRRKPVFKVVLSEDHFDIINDADHHDNGDYVYESVSNLKLQHKGVNWFVTILNSIVSFFFVGIEGELWKDKDSLLFTYNGVKKRVLLINCDMIKAEQLVKRIQNRVDG